MTKQQQEEEFRRRMVLHRCCRDCLAKGKEIELTWIVTVNGCEKELGDSIYQCPECKTVISK